MLALYRVSAVDGDGTLRVEIRDRATGAVTPAMVCITSLADGKWRTPPDGRVDSGYTTVRDFDKPFDWKPGDIGPLRLEEASSLWREAVAHLFESGSCGENGSITGVRITYGGGLPEAYPPTMALYFARWVEKMIPSINVVLSPAPGEEGLQSVVFSAGKNETSMRLAEASMLDVRTPGENYLAPLPAVTKEALMQEELSILGRDAVYERVLV